MSMKPKIVSSNALWPTRINVGLIERDEAWFQELADIARSYCDKHFVRFDSGFKHALRNNMLMECKSAALTEYFELLQGWFWDYMAMAANIGPADITPPQCSMFGNVERRADWSVPHAHMGNQVVVTMYPHVRRVDEPHPFAGAMVFHNPRSTPSGYWARKEMLYTPFVVQTGSIVAFPGTAEHSTFPLFSEGSEKVALVCNIRFVSTDEAETPGGQYKTFEQISAARKEMI